MSTFVNYIGPTPSEVTNIVHGQIMGAMMKAYNLAAPVDKPAIMHSILYANTYYVHGGAVVQPLPPSMLQPVAPPAAMAVVEPAPAPAPAAMAVVEPAPAPAPAAMAVEVDLTAEEAAPMTFDAWAESHGIIISMKQKRKRFHVMEGAVTKRLDSKYKVTKHMEAKNIDIPKEFLQ
jgi:hypothetical protein